MTVYISIIIALLGFSLIITVHELGHLLAAKKCGIFVEEFAIGMGPKLISKKFGETYYSIRILPLGGFCKMLGEDGGSADPASFGSKTVPQRLLVIVAGALMNFAFGLLLSFILVAMSGYASTTVSSAPVEQPAYKAGIREGDRIVAIGDRKVRVFEDILFAMSFSKGESVKVEVISDNTKKVFDIEPAFINSSRFVLGISPVSYAGLVGSNPYGIERASVSGAVVNSVQEFGFYVRTTFDALGMLLTNQISLKGLSGVLGIGNAYVESIEAPINAESEAGTAIPLSIRLEAAFTNVLLITTLITVNLGIMNLLPFPALDGGRAVFIIIEGIRRKPIDPDKEGFIHFAGFVLLMCLMVFVTYNDILKIFFSKV